MIKNNDIISPYQISMIVIMTMIGASAFHFVHDAVARSGNDGWIVVGIYGLLNIVAAWLLISLNVRFPGKTFPEYIQEIIGVIPGKIVTIIFIAYIAIITAYEVREFTEVAKMFLLPRTPTEIIMLTLILTCVYVVRGGVECVGRIVEITFPLVFIPFFLILLAGITNLELTNIFPLFRDMPNKFINMAPDIPHAFFGIEYLLFYIGFMGKPQKAYKPVTLGLLFVTGFYVLITFIGITAFGADAVPKYIWPLLSYIRDINIPGLFLERLDGVALAIWVITVFTTIITGYFIISYSFSKVIGTKEHKQYVLPMVTVIFYLALQPDGLAQLYDWGNIMFKYVSGVFMYLLPILLLIITVIGKRGGSRNEKA